MRDSVTRRLYIRLAAVCPVPCTMYHACFVRVRRPSRRCSNPTPHRRRAAAAAAAVRMVQ